MEKYKKGNTATINLEYLDQIGIKNLNYLLRHIMYQIFEMISSISSKNIHQ